MHAKGTKRMQPRFRINTYVNIQAVKMANCYTWLISQYRNLHTRKLCNAYPLGFCVVLFFLLTHNTLATSIVILKLKDQIIIGADSRRVQGDRKTPVAQLICKIRQGSGFYFVTAGLAGDGSTGFNVADAISNARFSTETFAEKVEKVEGLLSKSLIPILEAHRKDSPQSFTARYGKGAPVVQAAFVALVENQPTLMMREFVPSAQAGVPIEIVIFRYACPGNCKTNEEVVQLGRHEASRNVMTEQPILWRIDPVSVARQMVEAEIAAVPGEVGGPIDILRLTSKGPEWIQQKAQCKQ
jgi:hypothetical protein